MASLKELAEKFEKIIKNKDRIALQDKEVRVEASAVEEELLNLMAEEGMQNFASESGMTFYRRTDKFYGVAKDRTKEELVKALSECEQTADLVEANYNSNSLRSRIKEIEADGESLPKSVMDLIDVHEKYRVGHRSS